MLQKQQKKGLLKQTGNWKQNSFTNMVALIDIDALKLSEQIKNKWGQNW